MKRILASVLVVLLIFVSAKFAIAGEYKSAVIAAGSPLSPSPIEVPDGRFLVIKSFTQSGYTTARGVVTLSMLNGMPYNPPVNVLSASIVPTDSTAVEPVNSIVIAGPATVNVSCPDTTATCFVSYRRESN
jgi:hypothetical protein